MAALSPDEPTRHAEGVVVAIADATDAISAGAEHGEFLPSIRTERLVCLEQKASSVQELAKQFEQGLSCDEGAGQNDSPQMQGKQLLAKLTQHSMSTRSRCMEHKGMRTPSERPTLHATGFRELRGRADRRNADGQDDIYEVLCDLAMPWDAREAQNKHAMTEATEAVWEFREAASSLKSSDTKEAKEEEDQRRRNEQRVEELEARVAILIAANLKLQEQLRDSDHQKLADELAREKIRTQELEAKVKSMESMANTIGVLRHRDTNVEPIVSIKASSKAMPQSARFKPGEHQILGRPILGGTLKIADENGEPPAGALQWSRTYSDGTSRLIAGACKTRYSPDPMDVGCLLGCIIGEGEKIVSALTKFPVVLAPGLTEQVQSSLEACFATFDVVVMQLNGSLQNQSKVYRLRVTGAGVEMLSSSSGKRKFKADYSQSMQVCGARGGGDEASRGVYLSLQSNLALMLACENFTDRNVCIMLMRQFAKQKSIMLGGPKDNAYTDSGPSTWL